MRVGIIGLGSIGTRHAKNALALGHELMVWDVNTPLLSVAECDAVVLCTPADTHADTALVILENGFDGPLMVEKPLALSVDDCEVFKSWPSPVTMTGYQFRFHKDVDRIRRMVPSPNGGSLILECNIRTWPGENYGPEVLECSHEIDLALFFGAPATLTAATENDHMASMVMGGFSVILDWDSRRYYRGWVIKNEYGHSAQATFESQHDVGDEMYRAELAHFLDCAAKGIPTITPFADGIRVVEVCEQALKMANA